MARLKLFSDRDLNGPSIAQDRADLRSSEGKMEQPLLRLKRSLGAVARASSRDLC